MLSHASNAILLLLATLGRQVYAGLPTASNVIGGSMQCSDITAENVDNTAFPVALCSVLNADRNFITSRVIPSTDDLSSANITLYSLGSNAWESMVIQYTDAQAQGLIDNADGRSWWPSAFRMAALQAGGTGEGSKTDMTGVTAEEALQMLTGKKPTVKEVGDSTDSTPLNLTEFAQVLQYSTQIPVMLLAGSTTTKLQYEQFFVVYNYVFGADHVSVDGLMANPGVYNLSDVYHDTAVVYYVPDMYEL